MGNEHWGNLHRENVHALSQIKNGTYLLQYFACDMFSFILKDVRVEIEKLSEIIIMVKKQNTNYKSSQKQMFIDIYEEELSIKRKEIKKFTKLIKELEEDDG